MGATIYTISGKLPDQEISQDEIPALLSSISDELPEEYKEIDILSHILINDMETTAVSKDAFTKIALTRFYPVNNSKLEVVQKQIEYYMSDANLGIDIFFSKLIAQGKEGYLSVAHLLNCPKLRRMTKSVPTILQSIRQSAELEVSGLLFRRKDNCRPPHLMTNDPWSKYNDSGAIIYKVITTEEEVKITPKDLENAFLAWYPAIRLEYVRYEGQLGHIGVYGMTRDELLFTIDKLTIKETEFKLSRVDGYELADFFNEYGSHYQMCRKVTKNERKNKTKGITIVGKTFRSIGKVKAYLRMILTSTKQGAEVDENYLQLLLGLLSKHSSWSEQAKNAIGFTVDNHPEKTGTRCFYVLKAQGEREFVNIEECLEKL